MPTMFRSRYSQPAGSAYAEVVAEARREYHKIQKITPRRAPYVRAAYFKKDKVFINSFWEHLNQKPVRDRRRRLKLYLCAIDLIRNSTDAPSTSLNPNNTNELLYRFEGKTADGIIFQVQLKENKKKKRKNFISVFPVRK